MTQADGIIDWDCFRAMRARAGGSVIRRLAFAREDGAKAVDAIEAAMRARDAAALVPPAARIADEARQLGALALADTAEDIEDGARRCVEMRHAPDELLPMIVTIRTLFTETIDAFEREVNPLVQRVAAMEHRVIHRLSA